MPPHPVRKDTLDRQIDWLNSASGGDYSLDWANGGVQIACAGGSHIVSPRRGTKREVDAQLRVMVEAVRRYKARMAHVVMRCDTYGKVGRTVERIVVPEEDWR